MWRCSDRCCSSRRDRVDELVHEVLCVLPFHSRPVSRDGAAKAHVEGICEIGLEKKQSGQVHLTANYQVFDLAPEHFAEYFETFAQYARSKGWPQHSGSAQTMFLWFDVDEVFSAGMHANDRGGFHCRSYNVLWPIGHRPLIGQLAASVRAVT